MEMKKEEEGEESKVEREDETAETDGARAEYCSGKERLVRKSHSPSSFSRDTRYQTLYFLCIRLQMFLQAKQASSDR
jgi:hypothetical protein